MQGFPPDSFDYILLDAPCSALGLRPRLTHLTTLPELHQVCSLPFLPPRMYMYTHLYMYNVYVLCIHCVHCIHQVCSLPFLPPQLWPSVITVFDGATFGHSSDAASLNSVYALSTSLPCGMGSCLHGMRPGSAQSHARSWHLPSCTGLCQQQEPWLRRFVTVFWFLARCNMSWRHM